MLSKPKFGWTTISIGDWSDRASYLTDIHLNLLSSLINSYELGSIATVKYDAEGWEGIIVIDKYETHIIYEDESGFLLKTIEIDKTDLVKELINDIFSNLEEWATWQGYEEKSIEAIACEEIKINDLLIKLQKNIERR